LTQFEKHERFGSGICGVSAWSDWSNLEMPRNAADFSPIN